MNRFQWALVFSLLLHLTAFAGEELFVFHGPAVQVAVGKTRVAAVFVSERPQKPPEEHSEESGPLGEKEKPQQKEEISEAMAFVSVDEEGAETTRPAYQRNFPPAYPQEALRKSIQGTVWILAQVDPQGSTAEVHVERSSGSQLLDAAAAEAVVGWRFVPARRAGFPIASQVRIPIRFQIVREKEGAQ